MYSAGVKIRSHMWNLIIAQPFCIFTNVLINQYQNKISELYFKNSFSIIYSPCTSPYSGIDFRAVFRLLSYWYVYETVIIWGNTFPTLSLEYYIPEEIHLVFRTGISIKSVDLVCSVCREDCGEMMNYFVKRQIDSNSLRIKLL